MANFAKPWGEYILRELIETPPPDAISWFPSTWGWKCVYVVFICYVLFKSVKAYQRYKRDIYRRTSLMWFEQLEQLNKTDKARYVLQIPLVLKAAALQGFDRTMINSLTKCQWPIWLDDTCSKTNFDDGYANLLYQLAYAPKQEFENKQIDGLIEQCKLWIRFHRRHDD